MRTIAGLSLATKLDRAGTPPLVSGLVVGAALSVISVLVSVLTLAALSLLLPASMWGASAAAPLGVLSGMGLFFAGVLAIPERETVLGQVLPVEAARDVGAGGPLCLFVSACMFGLGHFINGGVAHGSTTFAAGLVFAYGYVTMRRHGFGPGIVTAGTAQALHNAWLLFVVAPLIPQWA